MHFIYMLLLLLLTLLLRKTEPCSRSYSKAARDILTEKGVFKFLDKYQVSEICPLKPTNDLFGLQEENKFNDGMSRWSCGFCGKIFNTELFLDSHMDRKHDKERKSGAIVSCLADLCGMLRCDIVNGWVESTYWERALCDESKFHTLKEKCHKTIKTCLDPSLDERNAEIFTNASSALLCGDLNCEKYYQIEQLSIYDFVYYFLKYLWVVLTCMCICVVYAIFCCVKIYQDEVKENNKHYRSE